MEGQSGMGLLGDPFDQNGGLGRGEADDDYESRSGSENYEAMDDHDGTGRSAAKRKKYHRHTPQQIQELENFFKECPHPDEKKRLDLGRRLGLEVKQVKFWFQNRRTQLKTQMERHENVILKQEYDKIRVENLRLKETMGNTMCQKCGGPALGELAMDGSQLRMENARLKDELMRVCAMVEKFLGRPITDFIGSVTNPLVYSNLDLSVGRSTVPVLYEAAPDIKPLVPKPENGVLSHLYMVNPMTSQVSNNEYEKSMYLQVAMAAMDELIALSQDNSTLWFKDVGRGKEVLNLDEYKNKFSPSHGMKPGGFITDATKETALVLITASELVGTLMDNRRWVEMFPCMVGKASTADTLCYGVHGNHDGELQMIHAEFLFPSPLVSLRQEKFIRYCKQQSEGMWAVVDVSSELFRGTSIKTRRLPSGCIVQEIANGSLVTWIEHVEYDENAIHHLYRPLLLSGLAFGAQRWLATLQRQCHGSAFLLSAKMTPEDTSGMTTAEGRRSILKLTRRITANFFAGICASSLQGWEKLQIGNLTGDIQVQVTTRVSVNEPGEPSGIVLSAATSVWIPVPRPQLFDFLRNEESRVKWDILSNGGLMLEMTRIAKDQEGTNSISLLCPPTAPERESHMLIIQEVWSDRAGSAIVYAPVDAATMDVVMNGGDSDYLALLPSGFAIADAFMDSNGGGSLLTLAFQILVDSVPTAKLSMESIETVNSLVSCTIQKIKSALHCA